jgi:hypothetical protein
VRIAHGLITWQDGRDALEASLRSAAPYVDHTIIADGLIDGVPDLGLPWHSDLAWLAEDHDWLPASIPISSHAAWPGLRPWPTLTRKAQWVMDAARRLGCDWLLVLDADEELHNGEQLRDWLDGWGEPAFPIERQDGPSRIKTPWHLVNLHRVARYRHGLGVVDLAEGGDPVWLVSDGTAEEFSYRDAPWISHHPERRPPRRRHLRLGAYETKLEPLPDARPLQLPPIVRESAEMVEVVSSRPPQWYCPGCGLRYFGPGNCTSGHGPIELAQDADITSDPAAPSDGEHRGSVPEPAASVPGADPAPLFRDASPGSVFSSRDAALDDAFDRAIDALNDIRLALCAGDPDPE